MEARLIGIVALALVVIPFAVPGGFAGHRDTVTCGSDNTADDRIVKLPDNPQNPTGPQVDHYIYVHEGATAAGVWKESNHVSGLQRTPRWCTMPDGPEDDDLLEDPVFIEADTRVVPP